MLYGLPSTMLQNAVLDIQTSKQSCCLYIRVRESVSRSYAADASLFPISFYHGPFHFHPAFLCKR